MGDDLWDFCGKDKPGRRAVSPLFDGLRSGDAVKRAVNFDGVKLVRVVFKEVCGLGVSWIEAADPAVRGPTGSAEVEFGFFHGMIVPSRGSRAKMDIAPSHASLRVARHFGGINPHHYKHF